MNKVVYVLGAGFSAPLGLPVMSNFLEKSKDMYFENTEKYKHFLSVFDTIKEMHLAKTYCNSDLLNIEEILSILEMEDQLSNKEKRSDFINYICDVIKFYTPAIHYKKSNLNWYDHLFNEYGNISDYFCFIASIFNMGFGKKNMLDPNESYFFKVKNVKPGDTIYSIVSLNYDRVFENLISFIIETYKRHEHYRLPKFAFAPDKKNSNNFDDVYYAKLHGDVEKKDIIAPTWNKNITQSIMNSWQLAHHLLSEANHIRFIGYSMPVSDSYIKYLIKSSIIQNEHLKTIDAICLDDNKGSVENNYKSLFTFTKFRFKNSHIEPYLDMNSRNGKREDDRTERIRFCDDLEKVHDSFMELD